MLTFSCPKTFDKIHHVSHLHLVRTPVYASCLNQFTVHSPISIHHPFSTESNIAHRAMICCALETFVRLHFRVVSSKPNELKHSLSMYSPTLYVVDELCQDVSQHPSKSQTLSIFCQSASKTSILDFFFRIENTHH